MFYKHLIPYNVVFSLLTIYIGKILPKANRCNSKVIHSHIYVYLYKTKIEIFAEKHIKHVTKKIIFEW